MTPSARVQAAIELLDAVIVAARDGGASADVVTARFLKERRYMGSKDRRAVRDLVYDAIRLIGERPDNGRAAMAMLAAHNPEMQVLFDGSKYGPEPLEPAELAIDKPGPIPQWLMPLLPDYIDVDEIAALLSRAPLDLGIKPGAQADVQQAFPDITVSEHLPQAGRLPAGTQVKNSAVWREGLIDIQDWGSQAICALCDAAQHKAIIDLCAGAGGKTLALAQQADDDAVILATDTSRARLAELAPRAERLGIPNIATRLLNPAQESAMLSDWKRRADCVLVDAPCSGTGVWRRNPEARWRLDAKRLDRLCETQSRLLDIAADMVRPGGILVYAVCSILPREGVMQLAAFLDRKPELSVQLPDYPLGRCVGSKGVQHRESALGIALTPAHDETDGFFLTRLVKS
ncbi:RsmB/NOP family class I SAM-dependent RNA methyltransferase [Alterisphingorhabdus coralli]|uniref:RsmB/NOP family class I SAM-dependent RNA methyltransferase n=1 Tax=Alterisphingorhabdus coralli TaxID=3071408 RepID=A0AA97F5U3_9SPHN|nr:RsmB/NOP family class I SAM-dependent RNA methyltransferase [Parasphingorhabdus sp. SCSIO 66989]WOE73807.1 RsmB/NOP family class I SAM-dependent RNA methyltransferase [Parasphingorhabdus sp. SCSIO 66989]